MRQAIGQGAIRDMHLLRIISRDPAPPPIEYVQVSGGIFLDMTIYDFDMARFLSGSEVFRRFTPAARCGSTRRSREYDDVDTAVITLVHENGCLTTIDNSRQAVYGYDQRVEAFGSLGHGQPRRTRSANAAVVRTAAGAAGRGAPVLLPRALPAQLRARVGGLRRRPSPTGDAPPVGPADARAPLVIGLAAWRSLREGRPVSVAEIEAG